MQEKPSKKNTTFQLLNSSLIPASGLATVDEYLMEHPLNALHVSTTRSEVEKVFSIWCKTQGESYFSTLYKAGQLSDLKASLDKFQQFGFAPEDQYFPEFNTLLNVIELKKSLEKITQKPLPDALVAKVVLTYFDIKAMPSMDRSALTEHIIVGLIRQEGVDVIKEIMHAVHPTYLDAFEEVCVRLIHTGQAARAPSMKSIVLLCIGFLINHAPDALRTSPLHLPFILQWLCREASVIEKVPAFIALIKKAFETHKEFLQKFPEDLLLLWDYALEKNMLPLLILLDKHFPLSQEELLACISDRISAGKDPSNAILLPAMKDVSQEKLEALLFHATRHNASACMDMLTHKKGVSLGKPLQKTVSEISDPTVRSVLHNKAQEKVSSVIERISNALKDVYAESQFMVTIKGEDIVIEGIKKAATINILSGLNASYFYRERDEIFTFLSEARTPQFADTIARKIEMGIENLIESPYVNSPNNLHEAVLKVAHTSFFKRAQMLYMLLCEVPDAVVGCDKKTFFLSYPRTKGAADKVCNILRESYGLPFEVKEDKNPESEQVTLKLPITQEMASYNLTSFISLPLLFDFVKQGSIDPELLNENAPSKKKKKKKASGGKFKHLPSLAQEEQVKALTDKLFEYYASGNFEELHALFVFCQSKEMMDALKLALMQQDKQDGLTLLCKALSDHKQQKKSPGFEKFYQLLIGLSEACHVRIPSNDGKHKNVFHVVDTLETARILLSKLSEEEAVTLLTADSTLIGRYVDTQTGHQEYLVRLLFDISISAAFRILSSLPANAEIIKYVCALGFDGPHKPNILYALLRQNISVIQEILTTYRAFFDDEDRRHYLLRAAIVKNDLSLYQEITRLLEITHTLQIQVLANMLLFGDLDPNALMPLVNTCSEKQKAALLMAAAHHGKVKSLEALLEADPSLVALRAPGGLPECLRESTVLHTLMKAEQAPSAVTLSRIITLMQQQGMTLEEVNCRRESALYVALHHKRFEHAEMLLMAGGFALLKGLIPLHVVGVPTTLSDFIALSPELSSWREKVEEKDTYPSYVLPEAHASELAYMLKKHADEQGVQVCYKENSIEITGLEHQATALKLRAYLTMHRIAFTETAGEFRYVWKKEQTLARKWFLSAIRKGSVGLFMTPKEETPLTKEQRAAFSTVVNALCDGFLSIENAVISYDKHHFYFSYPLKEDVFREAAVQYVRKALALFQLSYQKESIHEGRVTFDIPVRNKWHGFKPDSFIGMQAAFLECAKNIGNLPLLPKAQSSGRQQEGQEEKPAKSAASNDNNANGPASLIRFKTTTDWDDRSTNAEEEHKHRLAGHRTRLKIFEDRESEVRARLETLRHEHFNQLKKKHKKRSKHIELNKTGEMLAEERKVERELQLIQVDIAETKEAIESMLASSKSDNGPSTKPVVPATSQQEFPHHKDMYATPARTLKKETVNNNNNNANIQSRMDPERELRQRAQELTFRTAYRDLLLRDATNALTFLHDDVLPTAQAENPADVIEGILIRATTCMYQSYLYGPPDFHPLMQCLSETALRHLRNAVVRRAPHVSPEVLQAVAMLLPVSFNDQNSSRLFLERIEKRQENVERDLTYNEATYKELLGITSKVQKLIASGAAAHIQKDGWKAGAYTLVALFSRADACWKVLKTQSPFLRCLSEDHPLYPLDKALGSFRNKLLHPELAKDNPDAIVGSLEASTIYEVAAKEFKKVSLPETWWACVSPFAGITPTSLTKKWKPSRTALFKNLDTLIAKIEASQDKEQQLRLSAKFCLTLTQLFPQEVLFFSEHCSLKGNTLNQRLVSLHSRLIHHIADHPALHKEAIDIAVEWQTQRNAVPVVQASEGKGR